MGLLALAPGLAGAKVLRGGAFKPRSSPYSFQGHGEEGLRMLRAAADAHHLALVSEVMDANQIALMDGYVDIYLDGKFKGGSESPNFLGFTSIEPGGTFNASYYFGEQITKGSGLAGGNLPAFGPGTYQFQAYYTDGPEYSDYISSNFITVVVTP